MSDWKLYAHPLFLEQLLVLQGEVRELRSRDPQGYTGRAATKRLAALRRLIFEVIPSDPLASAYRQGHTLGREHAHWHRAKFLARYRLFFRVSSEAGVIVYVWVNDEESLHTYGSRNDAYAVFRRMLEQGSPPGAWEALLREARALPER